MVLLSIRQFLMSMYLAWGGEKEAANGGNIRGRDCIDIELYHVWQALVPAIAMGCAYSKFWPRLHRH